MHVANLADREAFTTKDGSTIRELAGPGWSPAVAQSLAEATLDPGARTTAHLHRRTEELYLITNGTGAMRVGSDTRDVGPGDCIVIPPGEEHQLVNTGGAPLRLLCCCSPPYSDEDTVLIEPGAG